MPPKRKPSSRIEQIKAENTRKQTEIVMRLNTILEEAALHSQQKNYLASKQAYYEAWNIIITNEFTLLKDMDSPNQMKNKIQMALFSCCFKLDLLDEALEHLVSANSLCKRSDLTDKIQEIQLRKRHIEKIETLASLKKLEALEKVSFEQGNYALSKKYYQKSWDLLLAASKSITFEQLDKTKSTLQENLYKCNYHLSLFEEARKNLELAYSLDKRPNLIIFKIKLYITLKKHSLAAETCQKILDSQQSSEKDRATALFYLTLMADEGSIPSSLTDDDIIARYQQLANIQPEARQHLYFKRIQLAENRGMFADAKKYLMQVFEIDSIYYNYNLALILVTEKNPDNISRIIELFERVANIDNAVERKKEMERDIIADSAYELARLFDFGDMVERDHARAVEWYTKAANQKHILACHNLAWKYENGEDVDKNLSLAIQYYEIAAENGYADAQNNLALIYKQLGMQKEATKYFKLAADQGQTYAESEYGLILHSDGNNKLAFEYWSRAAKKHNPNALYFLGTAYFMGIGVQANEEKAKFYLLEAATKGVSYAYYNLLVLYLSKVLYSCNNNQISECNSYLSLAMEYRDKFMEDASISPEISGALEEVFSKSTVLAKPETENTSKPLQSDTVTKHETENISACLDKEFARLKQVTSDGIKYAIYRNELYDIISDSSLTPEYKLQKIFTTCTEPTFFADTMKYVRTVKIFGQLMQEPTISNNPFLLRTWLPKIITLLSNNFSGKTFYPSTLSTLIGGLSQLNVTFSEQDLSMLNMLIALYKQSNAQADQLRHWQIINIIAATARFPYCEQLMQLAIPLIDQAFANIEQRKCDLQGLTNFAYSLANISSMTLKSNLNFGYSYKNKILQLLCMLIKEMPYTFDTAEDKIYLQLTYMALAYFQQHFSDISFNATLLTWDENLASQPKPNSSTLHKSVSAYLREYCECEDEFYIKGLYVDTVVKIRGKIIAIQVDGPSHFMRDPYTAKLMPKNKENLHDTILDIPVIHIPYFEWETLKVKHDKYIYIEHLFKAQNLTFPEESQTRASIICAARSELTTVAGQQAPSQASSQYFLPV